MKSGDRPWDLYEFIGLVVLGGPTAVYCYWIGHPASELTPTSNGGFFYKYGYEII
jgi:hypothetical protein